MGGGRPLRTGPGGPGAEADRGRHRRGGGGIAGHASNPGAPPCFPNSSTPGGCGGSAGFRRPSGRYRAGKFSVPPSTIPANLFLLNLGLATETPETIDGFLREFAQRIDRTRLQPVRTFGKSHRPPTQRGPAPVVNEDEDRTVHDITRQPLRFPVPPWIGPPAGARPGADRGDHGVGILRHAGPGRRSSDDRRSAGRARRGHRGRRPRPDARRARPHPRHGGGEHFQDQGQEEGSRCRIFRSVTGSASARTKPRRSAWASSTGPCGSAGTGAPAISQELVLYHTEGADAWGSVHSVKAPDHTGFASELDLLRAAVNGGGASRRAGLRRVTSEQRPADSHRKHVDGQHHAQDKQHDGGYLAVTRRSESAR